MASRSFVQFAFALIAAAASGCAGGNSTCVTGATQSCLCVGGGMGVQVCEMSGVWGACQCVGTDAGADVANDMGSVTDTGLSDVLTDIGGSTDTGPSACPSPLTECSGRCVDTSTDEANCGGCGSAHACASGSFCVSGSCQGSSSCPAPFVMCGPACIDPQTNASHCGATGDCSGANAGTMCGGGCASGRCVYATCSQVLAENPTAPTGLYMIDPDGTGPLAPQSIYCDMTTDGGGWTLVYKIHNDIPDLTDPWYGMVVVGSDSNLFPTAPTPLPSGTHFEGPTRPVRRAFANITQWRNGMGYWPDVRVTMINPTGTTYFDVRLPQYEVTVMHAIVFATGGVPGMGGGCGDGIHFGQVIAAAPSTGWAAGDSMQEGWFGGPGNDYGPMCHAPGGSQPDRALVGDTSIGMFGSMYVNTTTLFWTRERTM